ncbi:MAG: hypothetical protein EOO25_17370, partial [Comamonadaceae bacterium]
MNATEVFLIAMAVIFTVPYLIWRLGRTEYFAPLVVVQILAGLLLGPGILGRIFPDYYAFVFPAPVVAALNGVAWWGVILFIWIAGVELDLRRAWQHRRESGVTAALCLGTPLLFGCGAALLLLSVGGWITGFTSLCAAVSSHGAMIFDYVAPRGKSEGSSQERQLHLG